MKECNIDVLEVRQVNRIAELRKKIGLSQSALGEIVDGNFRWQYKDFVACL